MHKDIHSALDSLGDRIAALRMKNNISQQDLGVKLMPPASSHEISEIEHNKADSWQFRQIVQIADVFKLDVDELLFSESEDFISPNEVPLKIRLLVELANIPSLGDIAAKLIDMVSNDEDIYLISKLVESDMALCAKTLKLANSSLFVQRERRDIANIDQAISVIGINSLLQIVLCTSVITAFNNIQTDLLDMRKFWEASIRKGIVAQQIAKKSGLRNTDMFFAMGVLSGLGKILLYVSVPSEARLILKQAKSKRLPDHVLEKEILGFTHAEITSYLLQVWKIPSRIYRPIRWWLTPWDAPEHSMQAALCVYTGNYLQHVYCPQERIERTQEILDPALLESLNIHMDELPGVAKRSMEKWDEMIQLLLD